MITATHNNKENKTTDITSAKSENQNVPKWGVSSSRVSIQKKMVSNIQNSTFQKGTKPDVQNTVLTNNQAINTSALPYQFNRTLTTAGGAVGMGMAGAALGSFFPGIGTAIGGIGGMALGGLLGYMYGGPGSKKKAKKSKGWKTGSLEKETKRIKGRKPGDPLVDTFHHKVSEASLKKLYRVLTPKQKKFLHSELHIEGKNGLLSLRSNLALGPKPELRTDDEGDRPDYNHFDKRGRRLTLRSEQLNKAEIIISTLGDSITNTQLNRIIAYLKEAERIHQAKVGGNVVDEDDIWQTSGLDPTKYEKKDLPEYRV